MINVDFSNKKIRVETQNVSSIFNLPLKLTIRNHVNREEIWSSELNDWWWAEFPNNEMNDVVIFDSNENIILERKWDIVSDGSEIYKTLYFYCEQIKYKGKRPKGIAIGTHDGLFGEWVPSVLENITDAVLVEASNLQFQRLKQSYSGLTNVELMNELITYDGEPVEFFEGGLGYTNSIVERVITNWEKEEIKSNIKESVSINNLITSEIDWIHTDVEGYDTMLIMGIKKEKLPKLIIFEYENLTSQENELIKSYLLQLGYNLNYKEVSCIAIKK